MGWCWCCVYARLIHCCILCCGAYRCGNMIVQSCMQLGKDKDKDVAPHHNTRKVNRRNVDVLKKERLTGSRGIAALDETHNSGIIGEQSQPSSQDDSTHGEP